MTRQRALRIGDRIPPDAVEFMRLVRQLPPERYQALLAFVTSCPADLPGDDKIRRMGFALGFSEDEVAAIAAPSRRTSQPDAG